LLWESYLKSKTDNTFKEYIQIAKGVNIDSTNHYELICLIFIYGRRNSYLDEDVWDKHWEQIDKFGKDFDTFHFLGITYKRNLYVNIKTLQLHDECKYQLKLTQNWKNRNTFFV